MATRGRKASVRYYASKGGFFTHFEGKNIGSPTDPTTLPRARPTSQPLPAFRS